MTARIHDIGFALLLLFQLLFAWIAFDGFYFYDDAVYFDSAWHLQNGDISFLKSNIVFVHRLGLIIPVAFFIKLFGFNQWAIIAISVLASLSSQGLIYAVFRKENKLVALFSAAICGLSYYYIYFIKEVYPDSLLAFLVLLLVFLLVRRQNRAVQGVGAAAILWWCFLTKLTFIYIAPFVLVLIAKDVLQKRNQRFWGAFVLSGVALICVYLLFYQLYTGDALRRFHVVEGSQLPVVFDTLASDILKRLTYRPLLFLMVSNIAIGIWFAFPLLLRRSVESTMQREWRLAFWIVLGMFWFFTVSLRSYFPMPLMGRMLLMLIPLSAVAAGFGLLHLKDEKWPFLGIFMLLGAGITYAFTPSLHLIIYAVLGVILIAMRLRWYGRDVAMILMIGAMMLHPVYMMSKPYTGRDEIEAHIFREVLPELPDHSTIVTDQRLVKAVPFYYRQGLPEHLSFMNYKAFQKHGANSKNVYYLMNSEENNLIEEYTPTSLGEMQRMIKGGELVFQKGNYTLSVLSKQED